MNDFVKVQKNGVEVQLLNYAWALHLRIHRPLRPLARSGDVPFATKTMSRDVNERGCGNKMHDVCVTLT